MSIAIDLVITAIVLFCTWRGFKNGIIRGLCAILVLGISIYAANVVATAYSGEFTGMLKPFIGGLVDNVITDIFTERGVTESLETEAWLQDGMYSITFSAVSRMGLNKNIAETIAAVVSGDTVPNIPELSEAISEKLSSMLAHTLVFGVCFTLLAIAFSVVGNILNFVFCIPGLEQLDSLIGAVLGLGKALVIIFTAAAAARYIGLLAAPVVENTVILKYVININPITALLGI